MLKLSKYKCKYWFLMALIWCGAWYGKADEGMWLPHQMKDLNLAEQGLKMAPGDLYKEDGTGIMNAVVRIGGGATGAFVSGKGLILTNHHVAFGAIQRASDKEHDYITNGFLAQNTAGEIPAPGTYVNVLLGYREVTPAVLKQLTPRMTPAQRYKALDKIQKKLVAREENKGKDLYCMFKAMYSGNKYYLFTFKRLWDVRIVYAPPNAVGTYGGDVDNWMWPRHTCDFTFLRAYVSKDNEGVPYSADNVPYQPKSRLKISPSGVKEGDFTFIMGYPGRTRRNDTAAEFQFEIEDMEEMLESNQSVIAFFEKAGESDNGIRIKYASLVKGLNNRSKNRTAQLQGFQKHRIMEKKKKFEERLMEWVNLEPPRREKYGNILTGIKDFMRANIDFYRKKQRMDTLVSRRSGPALLSQAYLIYRTVEEMQKRDIQREPGFQERDLKTIHMMVELAERSYDLETDRAYMKFRLEQIKKQDQSTWPDALLPVLKKDPAEIAGYVDKLYAATRLKDPEERLGLLKLKLSDLLKGKDPLIQLAAGLEKELKILREKEKILDQERQDLKKVYMAALLEVNRGRIAPDANSTIRFTYGPVKGYRPRDGVVYQAQTTLKGVMEKETGTFPFEVPGKLKQLYRDRDFGRYADQDLNDIAACFINVTCVTGGSSGSPTLNARGEIIGIAFDMVYESVIGDYFIVPEFQRVINVDIGYVLFITDKFAGAGYLLSEMGL